MNIKNFNVIGGIFSSGNTIIANGRVINEEGRGKTQVFDESKNENGDNVDSIIIDSTFVDVKILSCDSQSIEAKFYGQAYVDGKIEFDVCLVNRELKITLNFSGNCFNSNLQLDIFVPHKTFKTISVKSLSADVIIDEKISTKRLKVKTQSGDLETNAMFTNAFITTTSGDVELSINATEDIEVEISTVNGDVLTKLNNIGQVNLSTSSVNGDIENRHKKETGYTADVDISTVNGDIKVM